MVKSKSLVDRLPGFRFQPYHLLFNSSPTSLSPVRWAAHTGQGLCEHLYYFSLEKSRNNWLQELLDPRTQAVFAGIHLPFQKIWWDAVSLWLRQVLFKLQVWGTSLVAQWIRLCAPSAEGPGSIPGQGARSHMHATTRVLMPQLRTPGAATKKPTCCN